MIILLKLLKTSKKISRFGLQKSAKKGKIYYDKFYLTASICSMVGVIYDQVF